MGSYRVYLGPIGVRGKGDPKRFDASLKAVAEAVKTFVFHSYPQAKDWHGITIGVNPHALTGQPIMCFVDGNQSAALEAAIQRVSWPISATSILVKQFFLAVPVSK